MRKLAARNWLASISIAASALIGGCAQRTWTPGIDQSVDFGSYRTYAYASESRLLPGSDDSKGLPASLAHDIARREIDRELVQRGWRQVASDQIGGDIIVSFAIGAQPRPSSRNFSPDYPWTGWIKADDRLLVDGDFTGRLIITLIDRRQDKVVLYGHTAEQADSGADLELVLAQNVAKILAILPPPR
jgi:hypothetical protein